MIELFRCYNLFKKIQITCTGMTCSFHEEGKTAGQEETLATIPARNPMMLHPNKDRKSRNLPLGSTLRINVVFIGSERKDMATLKASFVMTAVRTAEEIGTENFY